VVAPELIGCLLVQPHPECLSVLLGSDCRKTGETGACGGSQLKSITIQSLDAGAAMLVEVQMVNKAYRDIQSYLRQLIL
jgi:hypothetical protein